MLISINVLFPMLLLGLLASFFQPRPQQGLLCRGSETATLASVIRRGIGRMIDVSLLVSGLVMSVVLHPDVMGWWFQVVFRTREFINGPMQFTGAEYDLEPPAHEVRVQHDGHDQTGHEQ